MALASNFPASTNKLTVREIEFCTIQGGLTLELSSHKEHFRKPKGELAEHGWVAAVVECKRAPFQAMNFLFLAHFLSLDCQKI